MPEPQARPAADPVTGSGRLRRHTSRHSIEQVFEVGSLTSPVANTAWFRPLEFYTEELRKSGFAITSLTEPHPSPEQVRKDGFWRKGFTRPLFMLIAAQKLAW